MRTSMPCIPVEDTCDECATASNVVWYLIGDGSLLRLATIFIMGNAAAMAQFRGISPFVKSIASLRSIQGFRALPQ